jgi:cytosine/adenosine deaminase-related metal-dependent hydrolase/ubiquinone/menaquinone biosynthesis C-methylase UbiE
VSNTIEVSAPTNNDTAFAVWAAVYDQQRNPLLTLEERYLFRLLPDRKDRRVLDVGCGTGRWISRFAADHPASLHGIDASIEMLDRAATKRIPNARFDRGVLPVLSVATGSVDFALASFVLSYVDDLTASAEELARVIAPGGDLFLSDLHPTTAAVLGWKRSFKASDVTHDLIIRHHSLSHLIDTFATQGFTVAAHIEPSFGAPELAIFAVHNKEHALRQAAGRPAIYILHLKRRPNRTEPALPTLSLRSASCALGPEEIATASISIRGNTVASVRAAGDEAASSIDLTGHFLFPGLINAHDHLEFALFPRLGTPPYQNATEWGLDIQARCAETIALHKSIPKDIRLWWGGIRNLLSGVTTVCHHNPLHPALQSSDFPVHVVTNYGWEHSIAFAKDIPGALRRTGINEPFFLHAGEGIDHAAGQELQQLDSLGALEERTVLIHGLALDEAGTALLNRRHAALVICPSSNRFLFHTTHTRDRLLAVEHLALGSDSPLTADGNLLDELRSAHTACGLDAPHLYGMVTDQAARIVRLQRGGGMLRPGVVADIVAIRANAGSPADILIQSSWRDVAMVIIGGQVRLANPDIFVRLPKDTQRELTPLLVEDEIRWLRAPVSALLTAAGKVLGMGNVRLGGLRVTAAPKNLHAN